MNKLHIFVKKIHYYYLLNKTTKIKLLILKKYIYIYRHYLLIISKMTNDNLQLPYINS